MDLLVTGASNREIAQRLVVEEATVKTHVSHILEKLSARNRTDAVARYISDPDLPDDEAGAEADD